MRHLTTRPAAFSPRRGGAFYGLSLPAPAFSASRFTAGAIISASSIAPEAGGRGGRSLSDRWHDGRGMPVLPQPYAWPPSRAPRPCHALIAVCWALAAVRGAQLMIMRNDQRLSISSSLFRRGSKLEAPMHPPARQAFLVDCDPVATHPPKFGLCDRVQLLLTFGDGGAK
jgi:hypothetical protein